MKRITVLFLAALFAVATLRAQTIEELMEQIPIPENVDAMKVPFRFATGRTVLDLSTEGNGQAMDTVCMVMNANIVAAGSVLVDGYGADGKQTGERCNRVKTELIKRIGMKEADFTTTRHEGTYGGETDVVVVTVPSNVMASALRDFEIMRILSTPRVMEVTEEIPFMADAEDVAGDASGETPLFGETTDESVSRYSSSQPKFNYARRMNGRSASKRVGYGSTTTERAVARVAKAENRAAASAERAAQTAAERATKAERRADIALSRAAEQALEAERKANIAAERAAAAAERASLAVETLQRQASARQQEPQHRVSERARENSISTQTATRSDRQSETVQRQTVRQQEAVQRQATRQQRALERQESALQRQQDAVARQQEAIRREEAKQEAKQQATERQQPSREKAKPQTEKGNAKRASDTVVGQPGQKLNYAKPIQPQKRRK